MLDDIMSALDAPRSALWNAGRGLSNAITGDGPTSWRDILPGALGALGTAGLAATGFGLPAAVLAGSVLGGGVQLKAGNDAMKPSDFISKHFGVDPDSAQAQLGGMALGAATDPLSLAGALGGRAAGRALGSNLDRTAQMIGPRYATGADDIRRMASEYKPDGVSSLLESSSSPLPQRGLAGLKAAAMDAGRAKQASLAEELESGSSPLWDREKDAALPGSTPTGIDTPPQQSNIERRLATLMQDPGYRKAVSHVHPDSSILGTGTEAIAFKTPQGDVVRLGGIPDSAGMSPGRPISPHVLQANYATDYGLDPMRLEMPEYGSSMRVERTPLASNVADTPYYLKNKRELEKNLYKDGMRFSDQHSGNIGSIGGKPVIVDPGAVDFPNAQRHLDHPTQPVTTAGEPEGISAMLYKLLGGDKRMQAAVESGGSNPGHASRYANRGTLAGGSLAAMLQGDR